MSSPPRARRRSLLPEMADAAPDSSRAARMTPDQRDGSVYVADDDLLLAVDVALAARRPLLLGGEPGSGKSSLAAFLARNLGWRYYEHVVTARTRPRDLLWAFDAVRKLADASGLQTTAASLRDEDYVQPGVLWWAMDAESARRRGRAESTDQAGSSSSGVPGDSGVSSLSPADGTAPHTPARDPNEEMNRGLDGKPAVVLIDEIDKADPDMPNGMLVPLGSAEFRVEETGTLVRQRLAGGDDPQGPGALLVVITTNEERELPPAFIRRCVTYELAAPGKDRLIEIGVRHLQVAGLPCGPRETELLTRLAGRVDELRRVAVRESQRPPSTAELLDALFACRALDVDVDDSETWLRIERLVLRKETAGRAAG